MLVIHFSNKSNQCIIHAICINLIESKSNFFLMLIFIPRNFNTINTKVFGMSATVNLASLQKQIRNKEALLTGVVLQFVVLPPLGFSVVKALDLSSPMGITLLVLTSSPGGSYSNWYDIQCCLHS